MILNLYEEHLNSGHVMNEKQFFNPYNRIDYRRWVTVYNHKK